MANYTKNLEFMDEVGGALGAGRRRLRFQEGNDSFGGTERRGTVRASRLEEHLEAVCRDLGLSRDKQPREIAHAWGLALEAARAEEKRATQSPGGGQFEFSGMSLLRSAEQERGPIPILDILVPELRVVGRRIVVLEDSATRIALFEKWFGATHELVHTKVIRKGLELLQSPTDFLFLDFDVHDPGDTTLRQWLRVEPARKELDGLDLAQGLNRSKDRPGTIIVHSRNKIGAGMLLDFLMRNGQKPFSWPFDYSWTGPEETP
jgi:hypothetical protein